MKLGCGTLLYGAYSLERALDGVKAAGYAAIELGALGGMADHIQPGKDDAFYAGIRRQVESRGLVIESIGASTNLLDPDARARFIGLMEIAPKIGAPFLTSGSGGKSNDEESWAQVIQVYKEELIPAVERTGTRLSIKPHVGSAAFNTGTALRFMAELDTDAVRLNFDSSHIYRGHEDPATSITALRDYIGTGRIRDMFSRDVQGPGPVEKQIPGHGNLDLKAIATAFKGVPGLEYVTLEIVGAKNEGLSEEEVDAVVTESCRNLEAAFAD